MQHIDTLIHAGWVVPIEPEHVIYENHAIAIHEGKIVAILPSNEAIRQFSARISHRLVTHLIVPGFINAHTHAPMTLLRGIADDIPLQDWLNNRVWPVEQRLVSREFIADGVKLAVAEMLRSGTTCFNDMYFFPDREAEIIDQVGIRAMIGLIVVDFPTPWAKESNEYFKKGRQVYESFSNHPLIRFSIAPHAPYSVSDTSFELVRNTAEELNLPIHLHLHETAGEVEYSMEKYGQRPIAHLDKLNLLSPRLIAVHATQLRNEEVNLLAGHGVNVVHCPESNLKLASGFCPVHKLLAAGVNVAIGTDGTASNNDLDMLGEMRTTALFSKGVSGDARSLPAFQTLKLATLGGAKALGIDNITGSLLPGKAADLVAVNLIDLETQPLYDPLSQLLYAVSRDKVTDVWVAGRHLLKGRVLTSLDIHEIKAKTHLWREKIVNLLSTTIR